MSDMGAMVDIGRLPLTHRRYVYSRSNIKRIRDGPRARASNDRSRSKNCPKCFGNLDFAACDSEPLKSLAEATLRTSRALGLLAGGMTIS